MKKVNISLPRLSDLSFQIKLEGNWEQSVNLVNSLGKDIEHGYNLAIDKFSKDLLRIVKKSITLGIPPPGGGVVWEPLSPKTIKRYGQHPIYNLTGLYARTIGLYRYKSRVLVGLPSGIRRSSQKRLTLNQLAKILEFGSSSGIPPRPVWAPSLKAVGGIDKLKKSILTSIRKELSKHGVRPNQVKW